MFTITLEIVKQLEVVLSDRLANKHNVDTIRIKIDLMKGPNGPYVKCWPKAYINCRKEYERGANTRHSNT